MCNTRDVATSAGVGTKQDGHGHWDGMVQHFFESSQDLHLHDQHVASEFICWRERAQACVTCTVVPVVGSVLVDPGPTTESDSEMRCPASRAAAGTRQQINTIVTRPIIFAAHPSRTANKRHLVRRSALQMRVKQAMCTCAHGFQARSTLGGNPDWPLWTCELPNEQLEIFSSSSSDSRQFPLQFRKTILITVCSARPQHALIHRGRRVFWSRVKHHPEGGNKHNVMTRRIAL
jgi:hypothetical protein